LALLFKRLATLRTDAALFADVEALRWRAGTLVGTFASRMIEASDTLFACFSSVIFSSASRISTTYATELLEPPSVAVLEASLLMWGFCRSAPSALRVSFASKSNHAVLALRAYRT
jgi:hypothetical protein